MRIRGPSAFFAFFLFTAALARTGAEGAMRRPAPGPSASPAPVGEALPRFDGSHASVGELRSSLLGLLEAFEHEPSLMPESQRDSAILKLLGTYRTQGIPGSKTISESSFIGVIVPQVLEQFPRPCTSDDFAERERLRATTAGGGTLTPEQLAHLKELGRCS